MDSRANFIGFLSIKVPLNFLGKCQIGPDFDWWMACKMPFEIPRGIWVPEKISLAFCSPKSHGISRANMKLELIVLGIGLRNAIWNSKGKLDWNKFSLAFWSPKLPLIYRENIQLKQNPLGAWHSDADLKKSWLNRKFIFEICWLFGVLFVL